MSIKGYPVGHPFAVRSGTITTTNATQTHGANTIAIGDNETKFINTTIVAINSTGSINAAYSIHSAIKATSGTASLVDSSYKEKWDNDSALDATITVTGATARVSVTGKAANTITWRYICEIMTVAIP